MVFFDKRCQEAPREDQLFGICDDNDAKKAYTDVDDNKKWIAIVENRKKTSLVFTAIDKCILKDGEKEGKGRCDGMLTSNEHLYFVELKNETKRWMTDAIDQLESTINLFIENHDASLYKHKKAFACNRRHKKFRELDNELNLRFYRKYGFRLDVQASIIVV